MPADPIEPRLREILSRSAVVVAVGNELRGDDAFGPAVADALGEGFRIPVLRAGTAPENFIAPVEREDPDVVLVLDAARFGGRPGELRLFPATEARSAALSTHGPSLALFAEAVRRRRERAVWVLAAQAGSTQLGGEITAPVAAAVRRGAALLAACTG